MNDFDWKALVGSVSPVLATALGGPLAGAAVKVIADKVLGWPDASEEEVAAALSSGTLTGEQAIAIRQAELAWNLEVERIAQADIQGARQQTIALAQAGSGIAWGAPLISALIVVGYFGCIYMLFIKREDMPPNSFQLMNVMFGVLSLAFGQVCNYWLGSSAGSKRSGDALRIIAEKRT